ncbi:putative D-xylose utilization operon transcriptional repressor [Baekduia alba]|uniref:GntR family transcriptional regulator n=1 Tax=Baekduia alba TaxID=2997333 RepID=UPI0023419EBA|nr:GntR family transcriptional regulator [Baekduia alba]WCB91777.1 putative D-xylose utilization operon transcriptional repressor [Baekduia alba]
MQAERLTDAIHARVMSGELPAGAWLRQSRLATEFDVSRTPIREALQTLSERGVVELHPHRGARVRVPTLREIHEAYFVRAELEGIAAALAADLASQEQVDRLKAAEQLFEEAVASFQVDGDTDDATRRTWQSANDAFHEVIHEASHNDVLRETLAGLHRRFPRNLTWGVLDDARLLKDNVAQHRRIREAIEARYGEGARTLMRDHVQRSGDLVASRLPDLAAS